MHRLNERPGAAQVVERVGWTAKTTDVSGRIQGIMSNWGRDRDGRCRTTAELVVDAIRGQIERGQLRPGQRLPPERELAARIGVSRPSVRTGLRTLATLGIV